MAFDEIVETLAYRHDFTTSEVIEGLAVLVFAASLDPRVKQSFEANTEWGFLNSTVPGKAFEDACLEAMMHG